MNKISLEELARQLKVSKTLVSLVLNGKGAQYGISEATQQRVLKKAEQLKYSPNLVARGLRKGTSNVIGVIVSDISNPFYSRLSGSIEEAVAKKGYSIIVCSTGEDLRKEKHLINMLVNGQNVAGLIISATDSNSSQLVSLRKNRFPLVLIDRKGPKDIDYVGVDNIRAAREATSHLLKRGYRRIALVKVTPSTISSMCEREKGYVEALSDFGIRMNQKLVVEADLSSPESSVKSVLDALFKMDSPPDALFVLNGTAATFALQYCRESRRSIPGDIGFIGFDDAEYFSFTTPSISAVAQPLEKIGRRAAEQLIRQISVKAGEHTSKTIELPARLHARDSSSKKTK